MPYTEADTRAKLIDPALKQCRWTEDHIRREITQPKVVLDDVGGAARKIGGGRVDYVLRYRLNPGTQPVAFALIEAKAEDKTPGSGLEQAKEYRRRHNVPFVFSSNGHLSTYHCNRTLLEIVEEIETRGAEVTAAVERLRALLQA